MQVAPAGRGPEADAVRGRRFLALSLMAAAVLFCGVVMGVMLVTRLSEQVAPPPDSLALQGLRQLLERQPGNAEVRQAIRSEDARLRAAFFARRRLYVGGSFLLLVGLVAATACARWYASLDPTRPMPSSPAERADPDRWLRRRRRMTVGAGVAGGVVALTLVAMYLAGGERFGPAEAQAPPVESQEPPVAGADARFKDTWPLFRGPTGMGIVEAGDWPLTWNAESGENILWKAPVPRPGKGSPVVWGGRVFVTGGDEDACEVFCFDRLTGELLWRTPVRAARAVGGEEEFEVYEDTGYAAPTPCTDGERVYSLFATVDVAAVDFDGKVIWAKNLGPVDNAYSMASSPVVHGGKVILQIDGGYSAEDGVSALIALDAATGEEVWRTARPVPGSWSSPVVAQTEAGPEIVTCGNPWVIAYDPDLGTELWRADVLWGDVAASPAVADGVVYVTTEYARLAAIRAGGLGDVTETNIVWTAEDGMSDASSPVCDGRYFLQAQSSGYVTCYDALDGTLLWEQEFDGPVWASATLVGDTVYLPTAQGATYLFKLAAQYEEVGSALLDEGIYASPAFADSHVYVRAEEHLFCIGKPEE